LKVLAFTNIIGTFKNGKMPQRRYRIMSMSEERKTILMNELIDWMIEMEDVAWTIKWILDCGFSEEELEDLGFDRIDIESVK
jgi:uncharacterized protein YjiS (DUF1127 family)